MFFAAKQNTAFFPKIKEERSVVKEDKEKSLDFAQLVVNTVRMIPVVGKPTNIVNAGDSLDRKDRIRSVAISMLGAIPIVGDVSNRVSKGKRMRDPTKTLSEEFEAFLEDLPKGIYKKTITGASRKVISPERLAEMMQEKIKMLEFESARGCLSNTCFPGGTPILTQAGPIPIEQIKVGMLVNTQNPETGESGDQAVLSVSQTHVRKLFHIHVGKTEIKSTAMHRLYVQEKGFIPAQDLKVGDRLLGLKEGAPETFPIDQIAVQFYETPVIVYNFEVAAWHTYRVGEIGILVHNGKKTCSGKIPEPKKDENLILDLLGYYDIKEVITDIAHGEADLDTLKAGASLIPVAKITKVPKVVKAIGNVGKTGSKKGKEGEKISKSGQAKQTKARDKGGRGAVTYGELDSLGRPTGIEAKITKDMIGTGTAPKSSIFPPGFKGGGPGSPGHARGHLLGKQLGGSGDDPRNLITIYQNGPNSPVMRDFETSIRKAVENGEIVSYKSIPIYNGNNPMPIGITMQAIGTDGFSLNVSILNKKY